MEKAHFLARGLHLEEKPSFKAFENYPMLLMVPR